MSSPWTLRVSPRFAEHAGAFAGEGGGRRHHLVHVETEVMDPAAGVMLQNFEIEESGRAGSISSMRALPQIDVGETYALLLVHHGLADSEAVELLQVFRRGLEARNGDGDVAQSGDHANLGEQ
jgi:hypothetical protein